MGIQDRRTEFACLNILNYLANGTIGFCDYPVKIYSKEMQLVLTFIIPYALTGYYPVANLLEKNLPHLWIAHISPIIAIIIAIIAYNFWHIGIKHYGSTGA